MATGPKLLSEPAPNVEVPSSNRRETDSEMDGTGMMTTRCRLALQKTRQDFVRDLDVMPTLDCLFSKLVLTQEDCQTVRGKSTDSERRRGLLDILQERGQRAYHELCDHLRKDQTWLLAVLQKNYDSITGSALFDAAQQYQGQTEGSSELEESLRENLKDKLREWKTALEEGCPGQDEQLDYIDQPCTMTTEGSDAPSAAELSSSIKVVEDSQPGDHIQIYGDAGMGKTTLLKQLTSSWIDKSNSHLAPKFKYVFLIPMRLVGNSSLLGILCDELGLLPKSSEADLEKSLRLNERKVLFLLDSYEELREDVKRQETEICYLITGKLFPKSTVIVTSRPGSALSRSEHQKTVKLNDLPKDKVIEKIKHLFDENKAAGDEVLESFPAMSFLQKPINLALFLFVVRNDKEFKLRGSFSQVELFNQILQYLMLAYAKKRQFAKFTPQPGSYLSNSGIPQDIRRLFRDIAKKCFEEREENDLTLHIPDDRDLEDYLYFGLFIAGPDEKSVVVPHRLFKEYFAAAHLAEDPIARRLLFEEIKQKLQSEPRPREEFQTGYRRFQSSIISLIDVVQHMGLENILKFVASLAPQVCQEIGSLFVLERAKDELGYHLVNFEFYVTLLGECSDESGKHALATALVNAPVRNVEDLREDSRFYNSGLLAFGPYLNYDQCLILLKKAFNLDVHKKNGKLAISCASETLTITDAFVIAFIYKHDVIITTDKLHILGYLQLASLVPAPLLSRNMQGVRELQLWTCDIVDVSVNWRSLPIRKNSSLEKVFLLNIRGLENCDVIASCQCKLDMINCGKVTVGTLRTCFPKLSELKLRMTSVVYSSEEELTSWLSTIQSVESLHVGPQHEGEPLCLNHFLNLFSERRELIDVQFSNYRLVQTVPETAPVNPENALERLELNACKDVDLGKLLVVCSQCRNLKKLAVVRCQLQVRVKDTSDKVQETCNKLDELFIRESEEALDLGQLFELLSRFRHPNELWLDAVDLILDDKNVESLKKLPELQKFMLLSGEESFFFSCVQTPSGRKIWEKELEHHLSRLCPSARIHIGGPLSLLSYGMEDEDPDTFMA